MRRWPVVFLLALLVGLAARSRADDGAAVSPPDADGLDVVTLRDAAAAGQVEAHGHSPARYQRLHVKVRNKASTPLHVDMCASYLRPRRSGSCQRLGIGPPVVPTPTPRRYPPGTVIVRLEPGETKDLEFHTCCLDAGLPAPRDQTFVVAREALPPVRERVLRWWADNPEVAQHAVNSAIWSNRETVHARPGTPDPYLGSFGRAVAAHGGTVYRLREGELTCVDAEGIERILGTQVYQVIPTDAAVYAVMLGEDGRPDLYRLGVTGAEAWSFVLDLPEDLRIEDVVPGPDGNLVLLEATGLRFFSRATGQLTSPLPARTAETPSVRAPGRGPLLVVTKRPAAAPSYRAGERYGEKSAVFETWHLDGRHGTCEKEKSYWNVQAATAGPAGVFGISHKGRLRRLVRGSFKDLGPSETLSRILCVGRKGVWLLREGGQLVQVKASTGQVLVEPNVVRRMMEVWDLDPITDDLVYLRGGEIWRLRDGETEPERVEAAAGN